MVQYSTLLGTSDVRADSSVLPSSCHRGFARPSLDFKTPYRGSLQAMQLLGTAWYSGPNPNKMDLKNISLGFCMDPIKDPFSYDLRCCSLRKVRRGVKSAALLCHHSACSRTRTLPLSVRPASTALINSSIPPEMLHSPCRGLCCAVHTKEVREHCATATRSPIVQPKMQQRVLGGRISWNRVASLVGL